MAGSLYGKGLYGKGLYSRTSVWDLAGALTPVVTFAGDVSSYLAGNLAPFVTFQGALIADFPLAGAFTPVVAFATAEMTAGPYWQEEPPCTVDWEQSELCRG